MAKEKLSIMAAAVLTISLGFGLASSFIQNNILLDAMFRFFLLAGVVCFTCALNVFAGFDNSNILKLSKGEKKLDINTLLLFQSYHLRYY